MKQWGLKKISKRASLLALSGAFVLGLAACGHGGNDDNNDDVVTETTVSGGVSQGPIKGAIPQYGETSGDATEDDGLFSITIPTPTEPVAITFDITNATDSVTGLTPSFTPTTILYPDTDIDVANKTATLNANTLTTLITATAQARAGDGATITEEDLIAATSSVMRNFGFGAEGIVGFDPRTSDLSLITSAEDAAKLAVGFEAATEMFRRMITNDPTLDVNTIVSALAEELKDGEVDGNGTDAGDAIFVSALARSSAIAVEIAGDTFTLAGGTKTLVNVATAFAGLFKDDTVKDGLSGKVGAVGASDAFKAKKEALVGAAAKGDDLAEAGKLINLASSFSINEDSIGLFDGDDMPVDTTASGPAAGVLTLTLDGTVDAMNLEALANGDDSAHTPSVDLWVTNMPVASPVASGVAQVSMMLLDDADGDATRDAGERQIMVSFSSKWTSDGANLTLIAPSTAKASYQTMTSTSATEATLANEMVGSLLVTEAGNDVDSTKLKARIATLFSTGAGDSALKAALEGNMAAGDYAYSLKIIGLPMSDSYGKGFHTISGTFTAAE